MARQLEKSNEAPQGEPAPNLTVTYDKKEVETVTSSVPALLERARACEVQDETDYDISMAILDQIKAKKEKIAAIFDKPVRDAYNVHKFLTTLRAGPMKLLEQAEATLLQRRKTWRIEQERQRLLKEEEERKKAKEAADAAAIEEAKKLTEIGETEAANYVIERQAIAPAPPVIVPSTVPKQQGVAVRKTWKFRVKDPNLIKREFLIPDDPLDADSYPRVKVLVAKLGEDATSIVGAGSIEVFQDETESIRRRQ